MRSRAHGDILSPGHGHGHGVRTAGRHLLTERDIASGQPVAGQ